MSAINILSVFVFLGSSGSFETSCPSKPINVWPSISLTEYSGISDFHISVLTTTLSAVPIMVEASYLILDIHLMSLPSHVERNRLEDHCL